MNPWNNLRVGSKLVRKGTYSLFTSKVVGWKLTTGDERWLVESTTAGDYSFSGWYTYEKLREEFELVLDDDLRVDKTDAIGHFMHGNTFLTKDTRFLHRDSGHIFTVEILDTRGVYLNDSDNPKPFATWFFYEDLDRYFIPLRDDSTHTFYLHEGKLYVYPALTGEEEDPLGLSIQKWEYIVDTLEKGEGIVYDGATKTCGLCAKYHRRLDDECTTCPVKEDTGACGCENTPYMRWAKCQGYQGEGSTKASEKLVCARNELRYLRKLKLKLESVKSDRTKVSEKDIRAAYLTLQAACGFEVGDRVRVVRKAIGFTLGWDAWWSPEMDSAIGQVCTIEAVGDTGIRLTNKFTGSWYFPWFVLEKVRKG